MQKRIEIHDGDYWILVETEGNGGSISSNLHITDLDGCDEKDELDEVKHFNFAIDGLEALVLAHACAGKDVQSKEYVKGLETATDAILNRFL